ncbi:hypothetical protein [Nocardia sp. alder85J]|uniref:hypothetical protein n=1 Tax=Nocardia sp. alder85J TaxID=2862949 RepID=UPI001CD355E9|nr:hypothetical protein [Nocardia sp. alder85J]MCX4096259.1 hypothetical protein [Nocardia sp. alder85J]
MTIALGTAHAEPAPDAAQPVIDYSAKLVDKTVVTKLKGGTFTLVDKPVTTPGVAPDQKQQVVDIKDKAGNIAMEMPLDFRIAGVQIPLAPVLKEDGTVLELTPARPAGLTVGQQAVVAVARPVDPAAPDATTPAPAETGTAAPAPAAPVAQAKDVASAMENQRAMSDFTTKFGIATAVGGFVGTAIGAVIGCVVTIVAACVPGLLTGAGVGGIVGTIAAGGPTLLAAGVDLVNTMQAPDGTTQWADASSKTQPVAPQQQPN